MTSSYSTIDGAALEANFAAVKGTVQCPDLAELEVVLRPSGSDLRGRCPLPQHGGDSPSFYCYSEAKNGFYDRWYCHRCGVGGDVIDLYAAMYGPCRNLKDAMEAVAEMFRVSLWRGSDLMSDTQREVARVHRDVWRAFERALAEHHFEAYIMPLIRGVEDEGERAALLARCLKEAGIA